MAILPLSRWKGKDVKSWVELLGSIAPNDTRIAAARILLNEMQMGMPK